MRNVYIYIPTIITTEGLYGFHGNQMKITVIWTTLWYMIHVGSVRILCSLIRQMGSETMKPPSLNEQEICFIIFTCRCMECTKFRNKNCHWSCGVIGCMEFLQGVDLLQNTSAQSNYLWSWSTRVVSSNSYSHEHTQVKVEALWFKFSIENVV